MMKYCANCGNIVDKNDKQCNFCGVKLREESAYESQTSYQKQAQLKSEYKPVRYGISTVLASASLLFFASFLVIGWGGLLCIILAVIAFFMSFKEKRKDHFSKLGLIISIMMMMFFVILSLF
ncbi:zinc ribbon domain-containing protein [Mycoplasmatota bacterium]|nr:zinc ribbon domain-containing protein [Mycoplasmatota bacterium]